MSTSVVVYVHGLWLPGHEGWLLRRRLARALAADTRRFAYSSSAQTLEENAELLLGYLRKIPADRLHLVAHSLGGLLVRALFDLMAQRGVELPPGRVVLLGSPVRGSQTARRMARLPFGRALLGASGVELLTATEPRWAGARDLGVIAGEMAAGLGRLLGPMGAPNDGTVLCDETTLPGANEQLRLRVSHAGMPFSTQVALQVAAFLRDGRFGRCE